MYQPPKTLEERIKTLRLARGLSQENIANIAGTSVIAISRIERGQGKCSPEMLEAIKQGLGLENAPMTDFEIEVYTSRLWTWNELLSAGRKDEAAVLQKKLAPILKLPYEKELCLLYSLTETRALHNHIQGDCTVVAEKLDLVKAGIDTASIETKHLFHRLKAGMYYIRGDNKASIRHYLKTLDLCSVNMKADAALYYNLGTAYFIYGKPLSAILHLEQCRREYNNDIFNHTAHKAAHMLALCYMGMENYSKAIALFEEAIIIERRLKDDLSETQSLACLGTVFLRAKKYDKALKCIELVFSLTNDNDAASFKIQRIAGLICKAECMYKLGKPEKVPELYESAKSIVQSLENLIPIDLTQSKMFLTVMECIRLKAAGNKTEYYYYLENEALPLYLANKSGTLFHIIIDICEELETYYRKKRFSKKADSFGLIARDIYKSMFIEDNEDSEDEE